jgi:hypothetical protein
MPAMDDILRSLGDPTIRNWYLTFCFAVMVLPMIVLACWYHTRIRRTPGGRRLMEEQNRIGVRLHAGIFTAILGLKKGSGMMKDIAGGRYGAEARSMQNRVYWITGIWVIANVILFGLLIWADEFNRPPA